jgi:hypothetical protein
MRVDQSVQVGRIALKLAASVLLLLVVDGCQERPTTVSGAITLDGRPLAVPSDARGTVIFQPDGGRGTMATGLLDPTGHFHLATGSLPEVAQGKYYVTVSVSQLLPKAENEEQDAKLITPVKYSSARESGLAANVKPGENQLTFDLKSSVDDGSTKSPSSSSDASQPNDVSSQKTPAEKK